MSKLDNFCRIASSVFYIGYFPVAPGSMGSFAALALYFFIKDNVFLMGIAIFVCMALGLLTSGRAENLFDGKDASEIIIDEFTGMLIGLYLLPPTMGYVVGAFLLFRFFDIVKPKPIKQLEELHGGMGIMADDIMAGIYTNLILQVIRLVF